MPTIRVTKSVPVAIDGIHIRKYAVGWVGEVNEETAKALISFQAAELVRSRVASPEIAESEKIEPGEKAVIENAPEQKEASSIRVWELAEEIGTSSKKIITIANKLGYKVKTSMSGLTDEEAKMIRGELESE